MTHYEVLQVMPTASPEVIRMAYKALASKYHPDVFQGNKEYAEMKMKQINEAYSVLSSPVARQEYDRRLQQEKEPIKQHYQAPTPKPQTAKKASNQQNSGCATFLVVILAILIPLGFMLLDDAINSKNNNHSTQRPTSAQIVLPPVASIPRSGEILSGSECFDGSELTITADTDSSYVVKLKTASGVERLSFYVRAGETVTVGVPAEYLYVYFASGDIWYGKNLLFGDKTRYSMDDDILDFTQYTWEYTLYPVSSGNFSETPINPDDF